MTLPTDPDRLHRAYKTALAALLAERNLEGYWTGELSASALSTATAISALSLIDHSSRTHHSPLTNRGLDWLAKNQNPDGGWGDTVKSLSNISTTMLCRAAFHLAKKAEEYKGNLQRAEAWLGGRYGKSAEEQAEAVRARYGKDRTFATPILMNCALAGLVKWTEVPPLPFELACFPQSWFRFLRLHVVSYALPALIAVGQAVHHHRPTFNPLTRVIRRLAVGRSLRVLTSIQPTSGGFLEAVPLTSFVTMSLAGIGRADHPVARKGAEFIVNAVRSDGSWPIDSNLSVWVTTLALNALAANDEIPKLENLVELISWLLRQQCKDWHSYTGARPGGWGWTHLPGSVPDCDDTAGALLALSNLPPDRDGYFLPTVALGAHWLESLTNSDGGWPTFCRGWGHLPFDRSGADLTAHAIRALAAWADHLQDKKLTAVHDGDSQTPSAFLSWRFIRHILIPRAFNYLAKQQRTDGTWLPLWFGNQHALNDENPTYGTARVLAAYRDLDMMNSEAARRGLTWLISAQNPDGGWGGAPVTPSSVEETALAVEILLDAGPEAEIPVQRGLAYLMNQLDAGGLNNPAPIGFYFAKLWYYEKLYPIIWTVAALGRAVKKANSQFESVRPPV